MSKVTNVVIAGLGGQGVVRASDILAGAAFRAGYDVKKSEIHGMSQRGGSVASDVRFGDTVFSPMVPSGEADYLVVFDPVQVEANRPQLRAGGTLIAPDSIDERQLVNRRCLNTGLLGVLSAHLEIGEEIWLETLSASFPEKLLQSNLQAFRLGREAVRKENS
ncbi:MAG: indolepyruvate oxidoreductase subunit beta [Acidobacteriales bacterium]|nr:indolepyruvate oxidoreductase subunit beta [Terriglobales bacterium]